MNIERLQNIFSLIRENLQYLLKKTSIAIFYLLIIFTLILSILFFINGASMKIEWILSLWIGGLGAILIMNLSFPFGFRIIKDKEITYIDEPAKLFDLYFGAGLAMSMLITVIPLTGLIICYYFFKYDSLIFYLMGISVVSFFTRLGGSLFAKGADISSSLVTNESKHNIEVNDYRNVSSIADKIGDLLNNGLALNLDLIESFIGIIVAIIIYFFLLLENQSINIETVRNIINFPIIIIISSTLLSFAAGTMLLFLKRRTILANTLKPLHGIYLSLILISIFSFIFSANYHIQFLKFIPFLGLSPWLSPFICIVMGLILSIAIGISTDYYTSDSHKPVHEVVAFSEHHAVITKLSGLAVGMKSLVFPIFLSALFILISYKIASYYGIMLFTTGLLSMTPIMIASSLYAPFADNINGIINMEENSIHTRNGLDKLNAIGNTLSALAKNFSSYSVLILSFSLFICFIKLSGLNYQIIPIFQPLNLSALFMGGLLPFLLSSTLMRALCFTIIKMFDESMMQLETIPYLKEKKAFPDVHRFIKNSGIVIIKDLVIPSLFVLCLPIIIGKFFGIEILSTLFIGMLISGIFLSISYSNTGAVLDNTKKMIEKGYSGGMGTQTYLNAVSGDLFGDALKDVIGPSLNHFIKVTIIIAIIIVPIII
ncbi:MAG: hypothetical protein A2Y40_08720 [Candidatus Margulisbacteria bacterium GWF2_35_9]|nr:MAG: hypothetical protein A2Y40_08720 [Candidatus Margulisbacteria bacterium GWF2_35_9]